MPSISCEATLKRWVQRAPHYSILGTPDAEEWKSYRKTLNPAFSGDNIRKVKIHQPNMYTQQLLPAACLQSWTHDTNLVTTIHSEQVNLLAGTLACQQISFDCCFA